MNWLDIIILCLAGIGIVKGLFDGIIKQVVSLIALVAGIIFCGMAAAWLREHLIALDWFPEQGITILSFVLGFLMIAGLILLAGEIVHRLVGATPLSIINHIAGGAFGLVVMILFLSLFFNFLEIIDTGSVLVKVQTKMDSRLYYTIKEIIPTVFPHNLFSLGE